MEKIIDKIKEVFMSLPLDDEKKEAITSPFYGPEAKNILLSAGAGCGKTMTLSKKVVYQLLTSDISLDNMLILTFTNNSAIDMKNKIQEEIKDTLHDERFAFLPSELKEKLTIECEKCASSSIETFDSYSNQLVRKHASILGIKEDFNIIDKSVDRYLTMKEREEYLYSLSLDSKSILYKILDETNDNSYSSLNDYLDVIDTFFASNNDYDGDFESYFSQFYTDEYIVSLYDKFIDSKVDLLLTYADQLRSLKEQSDYIGPEMGYLDKVATLFTNYYRSLVSLKIDKHYPDDFNFENANFDSSFRHLKKDHPMNPPCTKWKKMYFSSSSVNSFESIVKKYKELAKIKLLSLKEYRSHLNAEKELLKNLFTIDYEILKRVRLKKNEYGAYTFNDISYLSMKLLKERKDIAKEERDRYLSIMVDEYQDSNNKQEELLEILGSSEEKYLKGKYFDLGNIFMVGDVKQSIYGFRSAVPQLFMDKYDHPNKYNLKVIKMNNNFRSSPSVIKEVNQIFSKALRKDIGEINYLENDNGKFPHKLISCNDNYKKYDDTNLESLKNYYLSDYEEVTSHLDEDKSISLVYRINAYTIARMIKDAVLNKMKVISLKGEEKEVKYQDFAILLRTSSSLDYYTDALEKEGIPFSLEFDTDFKDYNVSYVIINLAILEYALLFDKNDFNLLKRATISLERSYLINEYDDVITEKTNKDIFSFKIIEKLKEINKRYNFNAKYIASETLLLTVIKELKVFENIYKLHSPHDEMIAYFNILNLIHQLSFFSYSLKDIAEFLKTYRDDDNESKVKTISSSKDAVKLTTIHKSKGLQYSIVFLPSLYAKSKPAGADKLLYSKEYGFVFNASDEDSTTIKNLVIKEKQSKAERDEMVRILYVALTRARLKNVFFFDDNPYTILSKVIDPSFATKLNDLLVFGADDLQLEMISSSLLGRDVLNKEDSVHFPRMSNIQVKTYPNINDSLFKAEKKKPQRASKDGLFSNKEALRFGTSLHEIFEAIDYTSYPAIDLSFIKKENIKEHAQKFLNSEVFKDLISPNFYQEYEFYDEERKSLGSIDFLIIDEGRARIIDYKTKEIDDDEYNRQLNIYKENVSRIFKIKIEDITTILYSLLDDRLKFVD